MAVTKNVFTDLLVTGVRQGKVPARTKRARKWFREKAKDQKVSGQRLMDSVEQERMLRSSPIGSMVMFFYDPKWKHELPYYDKFPLIFAVGPAKGGFYGLNFHYLPYRERAKLMDALYTIASDKRYDEKTKVNLQYNLLKRSSKFRFFKPTFKHYLDTHVRSRFLLVYPSEWDIALFLPVAQFQKASQEQVWKDSKKEIGKRFFFF